MSQKLHLHLHFLTVFELEMKSRCRQGYTCVYPHVCLGIDSVSGKAPLPGQAVW